MITKTDSGLLSFVNFSLTYTEFFELRKNLKSTAYIFLFLLCDECLNQKQNLVDSTQ
jgi:hypothetical protein